MFRNTLKSVQCNNSTDKKNIAWQCCFLHGHYVRPISTPAAVAAADCRVNDREDGGGWGAGKAGNHWTMAGSVFHNYQHRLHGSVVFSFVCHQLHRYSVFMCMSIILVINIQNCSLCIYNGENDSSKTANIMNGELRQCLANINMFALLRPGSAYQYKSQRNKTYTNY